MGKAYEAICHALLHMNTHTETKRWTQDTKMCKQRGCECDGCMFQKYGCQLKYRVFALVQEIGKPEDIKEPTIMLPSQEAQYLIDKYKNRRVVCEILGCTRYELSKKLGLNLKGEV